MASAGKTLAFEYRRALPVGQDTVLHRRDKNRIVANILEREDADPTLYFIFGSEYCGKTSLTNTIFNTVSTRYPRKFICNDLKFDRDSEQDSVNFFVRQLFDQLLQRLIDFEIIDLNSVVYRDWVAKVDGVSNTQDSVNGLRTANILSTSARENNAGSNLTSAILNSDFKLLAELVKSKRSDFKKFILFIDDFDQFRESDLEKRLIHLLLSCQYVDVLINSSKKYYEYWELYYAESNYLVLDYKLREVKQVDLYVIFYTELTRINAPGKFRQPSLVHDIYETANGEFKNFLIICNLIWQQISSGRTDRFEINAAVLSGLITIAKRESAPETINLIESTIRTGEKLGLTRQNMLEVLAYKSLSIKDIARIRMLPKVPSPEIFESNSEKYAKALELFVGKGILFVEEGLDGHRGFTDSVVESYIRFHLRDERRKDKNSTKVFLSDGPYPDLVLSILRIEFFESYLKPSSIRHEILKLSPDEDKSWSILEQINDRDIFSIYENHDGGDWSQAESQPNDQLAALQCQIRIRGLTYQLRVNMMIRLESKERAIDELFRDWQKSNSNLLDFTEIEIDSLEFKLLGLEETNDLRALIDSQDTSRGMSAFHEHHYIQSRDEFIQRYRKIEALLAKYSVKFEERQNESTKLLETITDLKIRLAFTDLLVGHVSDALNTFFTINTDHLGDDISTWLYFDDVTNAFAFAGNWEKALEWSDKTVSFYETNIGFIPLARGLTLLQFLPDGKFGQNMAETDLARYHYDREEDAKNLIPMLLNIYLKFKNGLVSRETLISKIQSLILDSNSVPDVSPLRTTLWILHDTLGMQGVDLVGDAISKFRIPRDKNSKTLYDDLAELRERK